jgi:hypothetical protein
MRCRALYLMATLAVPVVTPSFLWAQAPQGIPSGEGQAFAATILPGGIDPEAGNTARDGYSPPGQQHLIGINLSIFQPTELRLQVAVSHQPTCTWLVEVFAGSELFDLMAGGGVRLQFTRDGNSRGDAFLLSPGLGIHVVPHSESTAGSRLTETFAAADVDLSWVHDFSEHFGYELGLKLGIAGRLAGDGDRPFTFTTFNKDFFPILNIYSGFRF